MRAQNGSYRAPSNPVTLTFPTACLGPPLTPVSVLAYGVGQAVFVDWSHAESGPAPASYVLQVTGSFVGRFVTTNRALSGTVSAGSYTLRIVAANVCGQRAVSAPVTVTVP